MNADNDWIIVLGRKESSVQKQRIPFDKNKGNDSLNMAEKEGIDNNRKILNWK